MWAELEDEITTIAMGNEQEGGMEKKESEIEEFSPKGAVAFFIVMIVIFALLWFSIYFEVLSRG